MMPLSRGHAAWRQRGGMRYTPLFSIYSDNFPCSGVKGHAFGLVVKKKIGSAVQRNRIKRRLRSAFACVGKQKILPNGSWAHVVVVKSPDILKEPFCRLSAALVSHMCHKKKKETRHLLSE